LGLAALEFFRFFEDFFGDFFIVYCFILVL